MSEFRETGEPHAHPALVRGQGPETHKELLQSPTLPRPQPPVALNGSYKSEKHVILEETLIGP